APRNQDSRNREITRRTIPVKETTSNSLVSQCDGFGYDWSDQAEEGPTNFALMAYTSSGSSSSSSSDTEVSTCSKVRLKSYETLKEHYDNLTKDFNTSQLNVGAYKAGLESVEARLDVYKKNEVVFEEDIKILKLDIMLRDNALTELRKKFKKAIKENSQVNDKFKTGVGYDNQLFDSQVFDSQVNDKGYHVVPPPYTGNFMPPKLDLVLADKDEYVFSESVTSVPAVATSEVKTSELKPKSVCEPLIKDWISDSKNENETEFKSRHRKPSKAKVKFVKSNEHVKSPRESVKKVKNNKQFEYPRKNSQSPKENGGKSVWNNARRVNHQNSQRMTHPHPKGNFVPKAVLMKSSLKTLNTARQNSSRAAVSVNTARPINTAYPRPTVNCARPASNVFNRAHSHVRRHFNKFTTNKNNNFNEKVNTVWGNVTTVETKAVVSDNKGNEANAVKASAYPSLHMTGNKSYLSYYEEIDGGFVAFGGNPKGGKITEKGKIRTGKLNFEDVYFVKELKFNLFSVSQMCDKKNNVLFTDTEYVVLSPDFKLLDESQVLLRVPRKNNMYNVYLKNVVPSRGLTYLFAKPTLDESNLWHRRLGHINFKTMNKLVRGNLARATKDETSGILKDFITGIENQINHKVKIIRCDNEFEFKNKEMNQFCEMKGIKREFSVVRTPQQNGVAERKNKTLIEAARTMLADSKLPTTFWAEAVNTACYVQNRVLVIKPHNKTPYELFLGRKPALSFMRPFGCPVTILNTLDHLGKFDGKADEGFFVGYSVNSKAFRVFNSRTRIVEETLHITFLENKPNVAGSGPEWLFDIDTLTKSMNYKPVVAGNQTNGNAGTKESIDAGQAEKKTIPSHEYILLPLCTQNPPFSSSSKDSLDDRDPDDEDELLLFKLRRFGTLVDLPSGRETLGYTQEEGIDYDEVFAPVARIEAIRLFLAFASFKDFVDYQIDVKSAFLYGKIEEEVYLCQPPGFEDPEFSDRVYKVEKALYGLHQAPRAWYETLSTYLLKNGFQRGTIGKTLFIKKFKGDILLVQVYVDDIIFGSTKKELCIEFEKLMHKKFQISSIGELTFFLGLQVTQKYDGIFISQDKYVDEILKKFGFSTVKTTSAPIETSKPLMKDDNAEDVVVHLYRSMIRSLMYLTSSRPDIMFVVCACARFQVTPKVSHLYAVKRIFRYLKGQPKLGLWYPKDSPFDLEAYTDSDYAGASLDRKSTT
ncbi:putative ribonuclease H-like domain-containing protein, partial [Tanacetum coccineum]